MDFKKSIIHLAISLLLSPIIIYIFLGGAKLAGSTYVMTNGVNIYYMAPYGNSDLAIYD